MIIRNYAMYHSFLDYLAERPVREERSGLSGEFTKYFDAFACLLVEKRIYTNTKICI
jgi:hypothetical protein